MASRRFLVAPTLLAAALVLSAISSCSNGDDTEDADRSTTSESTSTSDVTSTSTTVASTTTRGDDPSVEGPLAGAVIVVDPGHNGANASHTSEINRQVDAGGFDKACNTTGTAGGDYSEAQFNWEVAQLVRDQLVAAGATVVLTRTDNDGWGPCIDERGLTAQRSGADALVSIHADGSGPENHGFHIIHPGEVAGYTDGIVAPSTTLAAAMRDELVAAGLETSTYIGVDGLDQRTDLGTLNRAGVPAVILESGNMRNDADLALLRSPDGQRRIATAITNSLVATLPRS